MTRYQSQVLAALRNAREGRTFWTHVGEAKEKRAARELATAGLVVIEDDKPGRCLWVAPTRKGLEELQAKEVQ